MPSPRPSESFLRSDHRQNAPIAATMTAVISGINSRRSSLAGIHLALHRFQGPSLRDLVSKSLTRGHLDLESSTATDFYREIGSRSHFGKCKTRIRGRRNNWCCEADPKAILSVYDGELMDRDLAQKRSHVVIRPFVSGIRQARAVTTPEMQNCST